MELPATPKSHGKAQKGILVGITDNELANEFAGKGSETTLAGPGPDPAITMALIRGVVAHLKKTPGSLERR